MSDETQGIANAKDTRDLVLAAALQLARRTVAHVDHFADEGMQGATLQERIAAGGYEWVVTVAYGAGNSFVKVQGTPERQSDGGVETFASIEELAAVMGGQQAAFACNVPRSWVELAAERASELP